MKQHTQVLIKFLTLSIVLLVRVITWGGKQNIGNILTTLSLIQGLRMIRLGELVTWTRRLSG